MYSFVNKMPRNGLLLEAGCLRKSLIARRRHESHPKIYYGEISTQ